MMTRDVERAGDEPVLDLGDLTDEKTTIRINGQEYEAWVTTNRRYPRRIKKDLDIARQRYLSVSEPLLDRIRSQKFPEREPDQSLEAFTEEFKEWRPDPEYFLWIAQQDKSYSTYMTEAVCLLVPDLDYDVAELMSDVQITSILQMLGYFTKKQPAPEPEQEVEEQDSPLAGATPTSAGAVSTLPTSSPISGTSS